MNREPPRFLKNLLALPPGWLRRFGLRAVSLMHFVGYTARRFNNDGCPSHAAGLSYASLLALVPLLAIGFAMLAAFPGVADLRAQMQEEIFAFFVPTAGEAINARITEFVENASALTGPGIVALLVTAILLLININYTLNDIWRVQEARPLPMQLLVYWALLTLGPILIGASISISSYGFMQERIAPLLSDWEGEAASASLLLSLAFSTLAFSVLYFLVPNRWVKPQHALAGGVSAAALFELLKYAFGYYIAMVPTYQMVYGALSAVPIFLIWMYLSWVVALFGAEIAAALPEWRAARARGQHHVGPSGELVLALSILARLRRAAQQGVQLRESALMHGLPATPMEIDTVLNRMRRARLLGRTSSGRWLLGRDLASISLEQLGQILGQTLEVGRGWNPAAHSIIGSLREAEAPVLDRSLEELFAAHDRSTETAEAKKEEPSGARLRSLPLRRDG